MKKRVLNAYSLHNKTLKWSKYEHKQLISKYMKKTSRLSKVRKCLVLLKKWDEVRLRSISIQTNVCKHSGGFKRVISRLGFNRHSARQLMNLGNIPNVRKLS